MRICLPSDRNRKQASSGGAGAQTATWLTIRLSAHQQIANTGSAITDQLNSRLAVKANFSGTFISVNFVLNISYVSFIYSVSRLQTM